MDVAPRTAVVARRLQEQTYDCWKVQARPSLRQRPSIAERSRQGNVARRDVKIFHCYTDFGAQRYDKGLALEK